MEGGDVLLCFAFGLVACWLMDGGNGGRQMNGNLYMDGGFGYAYSCSKHKDPFALALILMARFVGGILVCGWENTMRVIFCGRVL